MYVGCLCRVLFIDILKFYIQNMGNHNRIMRLKIPLSNSDIQKEYKPQKCKKEYSIAVGFANVVVSDIASQQIQEY